ncbi:MAG: hypothetical protein EA370_04440 [Wenzhouxiangella sp.]|nr:MAG: hypothetical protein EA370_04440 [Wenzhouxiangella sp.]
MYEWRLFDNSDNVEMDRGEAPRPFSLSHLREGKIVESIDLRKVPDWAKPVFAACHHGSLKPQSY